MTQIITDPLSPTFIASAVKDRVSADVIRVSAGGKGVHVPIGDHYVDFTRQDEIVFVNIHGNGSKSDQRLPADVFAHITREISGTSIRPTTRSGSATGSQMLYSTGLTPSDMHTFLQTCCATL